MKKNFKFNEKVNITLDVIFANEKAERIFNNQFKGVLIIPKKVDLNKLAFLKIYENEMLFMEDGVNSMAEVFF